MRRITPAVRALVIAAALLSPAAGTLARALGHGYGVATLLAAVQAIALGAGLWPLLPAGRRGWAVVLSLVSLSALLAGEAGAPGHGLLAAAGVTHAILYTGLLAVFGASLWPGRVSLVTRIAARLNPHFHPGMVSYTRKVTWAWCLFFGAQLVLSASLLVFSMTTGWLLLVGTLHLPMVLGMALGEYAVRRWRFRHEHYTSLRDTIRGVRTPGQLLP